MNTTTTITANHQCMPHHAHDCPDGLPQEGEATADYCGCQCGHCDTWVSVAIDCHVCGAIDHSNRTCPDCGECVCDEHA